MGEIVLRPHRAKQAGPSSEVIIAGRESGTIISGCVLEAAVRCAPGWLLFVSDGTPSEDMLSIYLLGADGRLLDSARIGGLYATGSFSHLRLEPPATVHFRFIDDADWRVEILESRRFGVPWWPDARGVWRGAGPMRYFAVRRRQAGRTSLQC